MKMQDDRRPRTRPLRAIPRRLIYRAFLLAGALLNLLPRHVVFFVLVICDVIQLPGGRRFNAAYFPYVTSSLVERPSLRFAGRWSQRVPLSAARVLFGIGAYREASDWIRSNGL